MFPANPSLFSRIHRKFTKSSRIVLTFGSSRPTPFWLCKVLKIFGREQNYLWVYVYIAPARPNANSALPPPVSCRLPRLRMLSAMSPETVGDCIQSLFVIRSARPSHASERLFPLFYPSFIPFFVSFPVETYIIQWYNILTFSESVMFFADNILTFCGSKIHAAEWYFDFSKTAAEKE